MLEHLKIIGLGLAFVFALCLSIASLAMLMIKAPWLVAGILLLGVSYLFGVLVQEIISK